MNAVPAVRPGLDDRGAATDVVLMSMLMPMLAAARGIERRRFAGGAWMSDAGGAPMMSSVPVPIAGIVEAVDASVADRRPERSERLQGRRDDQRRDERSYQTP